MKKYKLKLVDEGEFSEIDFDLYDEIIGSDNVAKIYDNDDYPGDYIDRSETEENYPIQIDKMIDFLQTMKEEHNATYVEIDYHCDHIGYEMRAYKVEEVKEEKIEKPQFEMYENLYGSHVQMNDRFETVHIWSEELAIQNEGRFEPQLITKKQYETNNNK